MDVGSIHPHTFVGQYVMSSRPEVHAVSSLHSDNALCGN